MSYSDNSLRQLLDIHGTPDGVLSRTKCKRLSCGSKRRTETRRELEAELRERGPVPAADVAPLTPRQAEELRSKGLLEEEPSAKPSLPDRVRSFFR